MSWSIETSDRWEKDQKWYEKKRPDELAAVLNNLQKYLSYLNKMPNSKTVHAGFMHPEPMGMVAIDQRGSRGNLQETRLYTFADDEKKVLYLITIGNKDEQSRDIELGKNFVEILKRNPQNSS